MPKIPQIEESQPIFSPPNAKNSAEGLEAFAKTLGSFATKVESKGEQLASDESHTQLAESSSVLQEIDNNTKIRLAQHPDQGQKIAEQSRAQIDVVKKNAYLNSKDRANFNYIASKMESNLDYLGAKTKADLDRQEAKTMFLRSFDPKLQLIHNTLATDPKTADELINSTLESIKAQVKLGILTGTEAHVLTKQIQAEINRKQFITDRWGDESADSRHVNAANSYQPSPAPFHNINSPMDEHSNQASNAYYEHMSEKDIKSTIASGHTVPTIALMNKKENEISSLASYKQGAAQANGYIYSGRHWNEINNLIKQSESKPVKTDEEQGFYDRLRDFTSGIEKRGEYFQWVTETPAGSRALKELTDKNTIAENMITSDAEKIKLKNENVDVFTSKLNATGVGNGIPEKYRDIFLPGTVDSVKNIFTKDAKPSDAVNILASYNKTNRTFLAYRMPDDRKQLAIYEVGQLIGQAEPGFLTNYLYSQQANTDPKLSKTEYEPLKTEEDKTKDKNIITDLESKLTDQLNYVNSLPNGAQNLTGAMVSNGLSYVKYRALQDRDYSLSNTSKYINEYATNLSRVYQPVVGTNYMFSKTAIPLEKDQMDLVANHALQETYKQMKLTMTDEEFYDNISKNPLKVISTPTGKLTVVNSLNQSVPGFYKDNKGKVHATGLPAYSHYYNNDILAMAGHDKPSEELTNANSFMVKYFAPTLEDEVKEKINIAKNKAAPSVGNEEQMNMLNLHNTSVDAAREKRDKENRLTPGNIDVTKLPKIQNNDGTYSTVRTITIEEDGKTILIPTAINGKIVSNKEAIDHYHKTGKHLGIFANEEDAEAYDKKLHAEQGWIQAKNNKPIMGTALNTPIEEALPSVKLESNIPSIDVKSSAKESPSHKPNIPKHISQAGIQMIKDRETFSPIAYKHRGDKWTYGYGTTEGVKEGMKIDKPTALKKLISHVERRVQSQIEKSIKVDLTPNQHAALSSALYLAGHVPPKLAKHLNQGDYSTFVEDMIDHYKEVVRKNPDKKHFLQGWINRTHDEAKLFYKK